MSNFIKRTKNPATGEFEDATWIDHGQNGYSVSFPSGNKYRAEAYDWEFDNTKAASADIEKGGGVMPSSKIESLRRAGNAAIEHLTGLTGAVDLGYRDKVDRKDALADAHAVHMLAMALAGASLAAIEAFQEPSPPAQHYHTHSAPRGPVGPTRVGDVTAYESPGVPTQRSAD